MNESARVEAFSDGVMAIAITLLILEVKVPDVDGGLGKELAHQWPSYVAYVLTFLLIGIMWVNHHAMFREVDRIDRPLLFLNIILLMAIAFLPFPTALVARYIREGNDGRVATAIYSSVSVVIGCGFLALWWYLMRHPHLLRASFGLQGAERAFRRTIIGPVAYAASILVALIAPLACLLVYAAIALYFVFPVWARPSPDTATSDEGFG